MNGWLARVIGAPGTQSFRRFARDVADANRRGSAMGEIDVAIVDEVDAVMIDEAMSPLVLAGSAADATEDFSTAHRLVRELTPGTEFEIDDGYATVTLTDHGLDFLEQRLGGINLYGAESTALLTSINLALHAHVLVTRDVDYLVTDGSSD